MSSYFAGLLLIIIILVPSVLRLFGPTIYSNRQKRDTLSTLPLVALLVCGILFLSYGFSYTTLIIFGIAFFCFLCNIVQFYNFCIGLRRESFSPFVKVLGIIQAMIILAFLAGMLYFFPPVLKNKDVEKYIFYGNEKSGYHLKTSPFEKTSLRVDFYKPYENLHDLYTPPEEYLEQERKAIEDSVEEGRKRIVIPKKRLDSNSVPKLEEIDKSDYRKEFRKQKKESRKAEKQARKELQRKMSDYSPEEKKYPAVLYLSDVFVCSEECQGTLFFLAERGYEIYSFTFYDGKIPYFKGKKASRYFLAHNFRVENLYSPEKLKESYDKIVNYKFNQYVKSLSLLESVEKLPVFIIAEGHCVEAARKIQEKYPDYILDVYEINRTDSIPSYVEGYGNFQQVKPMEAFILKQPKQSSWENAKRISFYADKFFKKAMQENNVQQEIPPLENSTDKEGV